MVLLTSLSDTARAFMGSTSAVTLFQWTSTTVEIASGPTRLILSLSQIQRQVHKLAIAIAKGANALLSGTTRIVASILGAHS